VLPDEFNNAPVAMQSAGLPPRPRGHGNVVRRVPRSSQLPCVRQFSTGTLLYTSIFAAATIIDSELKVRRRNQLNQTIEDTKQELERLEKIVEERTERLLQARFQETHFKDQPDERFQRVLKIQNVAKRRSLSDRRKSEPDYLHSLLKYTPYKHQPRPPEIATTGQQTCRFHLPPQSPWADQSMRDRKQLWSEKKRARAEICITRLVIQICLTSRIFELTDDDVASLPLAIRPFARLSEKRLREIWRTLELLLIKSQYSDPQVRQKHPNLDVKIPFYPPSGDDRIQNLNHVIQTLWPNGHGFDIPAGSIVALCATMLDTSTHPDIQTCNILLNAFNRAGRYDLVDTIIDLVLDANFRPNELTCAEILRSYRYCGLSKKYLEFFSLMRGSRSGLMLASDWIQNPERSNGAVVPKNSGDSKFVQAIKPSPILYAEIIQGLLKFVGLQKTMDICKNLYSYGWGWSYACMHRLLLQAAVELDWDLCYKIWSFSKNLDKAGNPMPKVMYARMLALCSIAKKSTLFNAIFAQSLQSPSISIDDMLKLVQTEMDHIEEERSQAKIC
jgi:pentatricopeptide repeat protein